MIHFLLKGGVPLMMLPEFASAVVPEQKIVAYLLSFSHPDGRGKARFFSRFGFHADQWQTFAEALKQHVATHEVAAMEVTPFGTRYVIEGVLATPDGRNPSVRTVWFIVTGETIPHFVTAYPHP
jgi:hypothetical protein